MGYPTETRSLASAKRERSREKALQMEKLARRAYARGDIQAGNVYRERANASWSAAGKPQMHMMLREKPMRSMSREAYYKANPLTTTEMVLGALLGVGVLGAGGYLLYTHMNPSPAALAASSGVAIISWYQYPGPAATPGQTIQVHGTGSDGLAYAVNLTVTSDDGSTIKGVVQSLPAGVTQPAVGMNVSVGTVA